MKYAFSTLGCPDWSWQEILATASKLGYDGFEVRGMDRELYAPDIPQLSGQQMNTSRQELKELGLEIACLSCLSPIGVRETFTNALAEGRAYLNIAGQMGIPYIRMLCETSSEPHMRVDEGLVREALGELGRSAAPLGVTVLLETNGHYADSLKLSRLMDTLDQKGVGVLWDINHPYRFFGESAAETVGNIGKWIRYVHMKDSLQPDDRVLYTLLGEGGLPIADFMTQLKKIGYDGWYTLEWNSRRNIRVEEPENVFAQYISYIKQF